MRSLRLRRLFSVEKHLRRETTIAQQRRQRQPIVPSLLNHSLHFIPIQLVGRSRDAMPYPFNVVRYTTGCIQTLASSLSLSFSVADACCALLHAIDVCVCLLACECFAHFRQIRRWKNGYSIALQDRLRWGELERTRLAYALYTECGKYELNVWAARASSEISLCVFAERDESHPYTLPPERAHRINESNGEQEEITLESIMCSSDGGTHSRHSAAVHAE